MYIVHTGLERERQVLILSWECISMIILHLSSEEHQSHIEDFSLNQVPISMYEVHTLLGYNQSGVCVSPFIQYIYNQGHRLW